MSSEIVFPTPPTASSPAEEDFLTPFERENIPPEYKEHYLAKRQNFHANIQGFPELWKLYILLDKIILREFADLTTRPDLKKLVPLFLYFEAHVDAPTPVGHAGFMTADCSNQNEPKTSEHYPDTVDRESANC